MSPDERLAAVEALAEKWLVERLNYPLDDPRASVAFIVVKMCEDELRAVLRGERP